MKKLVSIALAVLMLAGFVSMGGAEEAMKPYEDAQEMRDYSQRGEQFTLAAGQFTGEDIFTYSFESDTIFEGAEDTAEAVLEAGKNPGLGVRELHAQGITGAGVNVAVIDQNFLADHPEYAGRVVAYYDSGTETPAGAGSYHAPSVVSLLGGETTGVAPGVNLYVAAAPSWKLDASYYGDSLRWIIEQNKGLPDGEKIRLVSVSAAPEAGYYKNAFQWDKAVAEAASDGIFVLDCRGDAETGFVFASYFDPQHPEDVTKSKPGYPDKAHDDFTSDFWKQTLFAPASYRTMAREYVSDQPLYGYSGTGGQSWAVPYVAGVMVLGFQLRPDLTGEELRDLLFETSWKDADGLSFADPVAFVEAVKALPEK